MTDKQLDRIMASVRDKERDSEGRTAAVPRPHGKKKMSTPKGAVGQKPTEVVGGAEKIKAPTHRRKGKEQARGKVAPTDPVTKKTGTRGGSMPTEPQKTEEKATPTVGREPKGGSGKRKGTKEKRTAPTGTQTKAPKSGGASRGKKARGKLRVVSLGGLQEIGKNITMLEYGNDIILVDCGMGFPDEEMPGVDLVIPDFTYLEQNADRVRGLLLTHGHEDHIGGVPYLLRRLSIPVYGTRLTLGILEKKLEEFRYDKNPDLRRVEAGEIVHLGESFHVEFIRVNHSIADACALAIRTPVGMVIHSGDFKLDVSPIDGQMMDLVRLGELGNAGVELLLCESTNAERSGFTPSERMVGGSFEQIFLAHPHSRLVIATFSSNIHRVQQIIDASYRHGRRVAVLGRSMVNVIGAAVELGYIDVPDGALIDISEIKRYKPEQITLVTTGSQGEPMSALYRLAFSEHDKVKLTTEDVVVISASAIPGNEKLVGKIINALIKNGVKVIHDHSMNMVHVSGHACREELKLMHALVKPRFFMPIHGEYRHLYAHKELAEFMGMEPDHIFVSEIGKVLALDGVSAKWDGTVPAGQVLIDGSGIGDVGAVVLRDRKHLAEDGLIVAVVAVDMYGGQLVSGPELITRGFVYVKESAELMDEARASLSRSLEKELRGGTDDYNALKTVLRDELSKFFFKKTRRRPMVLPVVITL